MLPLVRHWGTLRPIAGVRPNQTIPPKLSPGHDPRAEARGRVEPSTALLESKRVRWFTRRRGDAGNNKFIDHSRRTAVHSDLPKFSASPRLRVKKAGTQSAKREGSPVTQLSDESSDRFSDAEVAETLRTSLVIRLANEPLIRCSLRLCVGITAVSVNEPCTATGASRSIVVPSPT